MLACSASARDYNLSSGQQAITLQPAKANVTLRQAIDDFIAERKRGNQWTDATEKDRKPQFNLLCEMLGENTDITSVDAFRAAEVKKTLLVLPKNRNKNPKTRDLKLEQAIKVEGVEKIHIKTVNEYLIAYQSLFGWAEDNGLITRNPFKRLAVKQKATKKDKRKPFTPEQINAILNAIKGETPEKSGTSYRYWGVMLGIYTGARLNEIAQLTLADINQEEGIWYFDINDEDDEEEGGQKRLKNESSKRRVPIHNALLEAGIIERVAKLKEKGETRLFPDLKYMKGHKYGRALARWFNEKLLAELKMKGQSLSFHSFRHAFATNLLNAGVQEGIAQDLMGHAKQGTTQTVYNKGYVLKVLQESINKCPFFSD